MFMNRLFLKRSLTATNMMRLSNMRMFSTNSKWLLERMNSIHQTNPDATVGLVVH